MTQKPGFRDYSRTPVFDRAQSLSCNPAQRALSGPACSNTSIFGAFRRTDRDKPGTPVTGKLLGDPAPGRVVPVLPAETRQGYREAEPAPIYLTFMEYEAATGQRVTL